VGLQGDVTVANAPAKVKQQVGAGELIATGSKSLARFNLGINGPGLNVLENSSVTLDELTADTSGSAPVITTRISVKAGSAAGYVKKLAPQSVYTVSTLTTTAAIKGTKWKVYANGRVAVTEGCVTVTTSKGGKFDVCKGQAYDPDSDSVVAASGADFDDGGGFNGEGTPSVFVPSGFTPTRPVTSGASTGNP
jgi:hypothetical protein